MGKYQKADSAVLSFQHIMEYIRDERKRCALDSYDKKVIEHLATRLTEKETSALIDYYCNGLGVSETAKKDGKSPSTICRNRQRGEEKIRSAVKTFKDITPMKFTYERGLL